MLTLKRWQTRKNLARTALVVAVGCWAAPALADDCTRTNLDTRSAEYAVAATMAGRYMRLASAANYADRELLKQLEKTEADRSGGRGIIGIHYDWFFGATTAPVKLEGNGCAPFGRVPYDIYSANLGVAFAYGPVSVFYASSVAFGAAQDDFGRYVAATITPPIGNGYSLVAPFVGSKDGTYKGILYSFDYIAGAGVQTKYFTAQAGYVGSTGVFGRVTQPDLKLVGALALRTISQELAYVRAGLDFLQLAKQTKDDVLAIAPYFRQIKQSPPQRLLNPSGGDFENVNDLRGFSFRTIHAEVANLVPGWVDIQSAYGLPPFNKLHQLGVRGHTPGFSLAGVPPTRSSGGNGFTGGSLSIGVVRVPEQRLMNQSGKPLLNVSAEGQYGRYRALKVAIHFNNPEILSQYPTASNSVTMTLTLLLDTTHSY